MVRYIGSLKKFILFSVLVMVLAGVGPASAQGLIPDFPSFSWNPFSSQASYGGRSGASVGPLELYVGWMEDRQGSSFSVNNTGSIVGGIVSFKRQFPLRGLWVGASESIKLSDNISIMASGWYLATSVTCSTETYTDLAQAALLFMRRNWDGNNKWWFVDGLLCLGSPTGLNLLVGARYDDFTTHFKNPYDIAGISSASTDTADVTSYGVIPLIGTQWAYYGADTNLVFRAVGVPALIGSLKYNETFGATMRAEARGDYNRGYFLEFFSEYTKRFGAGQVGVFGRYNLTNGSSNVDLAVSGAGRTEYQLSLYRSSWTLGGVVTLGFNSPL